MSPETGLKLTMRYCGRAIYDIKTGCFVSLILVFISDSFRNTFTLIPRAGVRRESN